MFKDTNTGQTHYVGDGCNPPHLPLVEKEKSEVNIRQYGEGYLIEIEDEFIKNSFAITKTELEKIVLYGEKILKDN